MLSENNNNFSENRKFLRINASDIGRLVCTIHISPEKNINLESTDISPGGFGAIIPSYHVANFHKGSAFSHCQINLPGMTHVSIRLVDMWPLNKNESDLTMLAGFEFTSDLDWLSTGLESCVMPD